MISIISIFFFINILRVKKLLLDLMRTSSSYKKNVRKKRGITKKIIAINEIRKAKDSFKKAVKNDIVPCKFSDISHVIKKIFSTKHI